MGREHSAAFVGSLFGQSRARRVVFSMGILIPNATCAIAKGDADESIAFLNPLA